MEGLGGVTRPLAYVSGCDVTGHPTPTSMDRTPVFHVTGWDVFPYRTSSSHRLLTSADTGAVAVPGRTGASWVRDHGVLGACCLLVTTNP